MSQLSQPTPIGGAKTPLTKKTRKSTTGTTLTTIKDIFSIAKNIKDILAFGVSLAGLANTAHAPAPSAPPPPTCDPQLIQVAFDQASVMCRDVPQWVDRMSIPSRFGGLTPDCAI